jgi:general stress protein 26
MKILNGSPGFGSPLNEEEIKTFLTNNKLNVHLGTVDEKGHPNIHPAWYYFEPSNNRIYVETSKHSKKTFNVKRKNEYVYFCIDDPQPPYKGVRGKATVNVYEDIEHNIPIAEKIMVRYLGNLEHPIAQALLNAVKKGDSVILEILPKYYSTWDYSKSG